MAAKANSRFFFLALSLAIVGVVTWAMAASATAPSPAPTASAVVMPTPESWLIVPTLSPDATQADHGAEVYRLVCQACHGDRGQGLTDEWRASWAPADQNCWQSKCHAVNHPPEGFVLPRAAPAIVGPGTLTKFLTAADLQAFVKASMPWHAPGSLTDDEYWQLTAYLVRANGYGDLALGPANAAEVRLAASIITLVPSVPVTESSQTVLSWGRAAMVVILVSIGILGAWLVGRRRARRDGR